MKQTFKLKKGEILFDEDKIIITDDAKKQKWILTTILCFGAIYGFLTLSRFYNTGDQTSLWFGLLICLLNILVLIPWLLRSVRSQITLDEVKSMNVRQRSGNKFLDINLKNNRLRRVIRVDNSDELNQYIDLNIRTKKNYGC